MRRKMATPTYLTGVFAATRGHVKLKRIYKRTNRLLQIIPRDAAYRLNLEAIMCHRLNLLNEAGDDIKEVEEYLGGKVEILITQAEREFDLVTKMLLWKPWERSASPPPPGQWDWPPVPQ